MYHRHIYHKRTLLQCSFTNKIFSQNYIVIVYLLVLKLSLQKKVKFNAECEKFQNILILSNNNIRINYPIKPPRHFVFTFLNCLSHKRKFYSVRIKHFNCISFKEIRKCLIYCIRISRLQFIQKIFIELLFKCF